MDPLSQQRELIAGLRRRDRTAQRALFAEHYERLQRLCRARLRLAEQDAEEVAEEALTVLILRPSRFDPERGVPLAAWLWRIARNRGIDVLRREQGLRETALTRTLAAPSAGEPERGPLWRVAVEVARLAERLTPDQQKALELYASGLAHREIGRLLNKSEAAARQVVSRARRRMTQAVEAGALGEEATAILRRCLERGKAEGNGAAFRSGSPGAAAVTGSRTPGRERKQPTCVSSRTLSSPR